MIKAYSNNIFLSTPPYKVSPYIWWFVAVFMFLGLCLVGSCKTADLPGAYGSSVNSEQFRVALFPDSQLKKLKDVSEYSPAKGYVNTARKYVTHTPESLLMLTEKETRFIFGNPEVTRFEAPAEIWQYQSSNCVLDLYFYPVENNAAGVSYYEIRQETDNILSISAKKKHDIKCLNEISKHRAS